MVWASSYTRIAVGVVVLGLFALGLSEYTAHVRADAEAQATIAAQATYQKQLTSQMADLQKAMAERDANYQKQLQSLSSRMQQAVTPQQLAALVGQVMGLQKPIEVTVPQATVQNPNPQPVAIVPSEDAPQVKAYIQDCETCKLQVPKLQADLADREAQAKIAQQQIESLKTQRDAAIKAEKGGNWFRRTGKALKYIGIGAAGGAIAVCATGHCK